MMDMLKKSLIGVAVLIAGLSSAPVMAQVTVNVDSDSVTFDIGDNDSGADFELEGNDFEDYLLANGFTFGAADADIVVTESGTFSFSVIGNESSFSSSFFVRFSEATNQQGFNSFVNGNSGSGLGLSNKAYIAEPGEIPLYSFYFGSTNNQGTTNYYTFYSSNFAVLTPDSSTLSGLSDIILAFNDGSTVDGDYDDLVIRASFVADAIAQVPEPASLGLFALGLGAIWRRQRKATEKV